VTGQFSKFSCPKRTPSRRWVSNMALLRRVRAARGRSVLVPIVFYSKKEPNEHHNPVDVFKHRSTEKAALEAAAKVELRGASNYAQHFLSGCREANREDWGASG
jgi:hypothetical protein